MRSRTRFESHLVERRSAAGRAHGRALPDPWCSQARAEALEAHAAELLAGGAGGIGYLLKDRVGRVEEFLDALQRVAAGGTALDPEVVAQLMTSRHDPLRTLTPREREVLGLMAQGLDNATIATTLVLTERSVSKHIGAVFTKLGLPQSDSGHRRVLAVLAYLNS
ncbi:response regulator transcription factor [Actinomadura sp. 9N407]|uniref:response regulator transcription factor n=1 Tax=Actinomadura sp. 9N407 TaxID=3375154 RepID=UPI0037AFE6A9